jgi:hypothetical protein
LRTAAGAVYRDNRRSSTIDQFGDRRPVQPALEREQPVAVDQRDVETLALAADVNTQPPVHRRIIARNERWTPFAQSASGLEVLPGTFGGVREAALEETLLGPRLG